MIVAQVSRFDDDFSALRRELHRILDQVPKDLLESRRVAVDVFVFRPKPELKLEILLQNVLATNFVSALQAFREWRLLRD